MKLFRKTQLYRYLFSFIFSVLAVLVFYALRWTIPKNISMYDEIVTIVFIVVAILILFPTRKKILSYFFHSRDYAFMLSGDFSDLDISTQPFAMETLLHKEFPVFLDWLGMSSGAIAILDPERKSYNLYYYHNKKMIRQQNLDRRTCEKLCRCLAELPTDGKISINETSLSEDVRQYMKELNAYHIYPLRYRKVVMGFLVFHKSLRKSYTKHILQTFKYKAALSVQNYILSHRVIDSRIYDQEFKIAQRIHGALKSSEAPKISHYEIKWSKPEMGVVSDFFLTDRKHWLFVSLSYMHFTGSVGILIYSILGQIYSLINMKRYLGLEQLAREIAITHSWQQTDLPINVLLLELGQRNPKFNFFMTGKDFTIFQQEKLSPNEKQYLPIKGVLSLKDKTELQVSYLNTPFLNLFYDRDVEFAEQSAS